MTDKHRRTSFASYTSTRTISVGSIGDGEGAAGHVDTTLLLILHQFGFERRPKDRLSVGRRCQRADDLELGMDALIGGVSAPVEQVLLEARTSPQCLLADLRGVDLI